MPVTGIVEALHSSSTHTFSKTGRDLLRLVTGIGIEGDAHAGETVKHRSRVAVNPAQPNLRQVHLIAAEKLESLSTAGFDIAPGDMGENITTRGIDLHALSAGTRLCIGEVEIEITGLRNPCHQIENFRTGLLSQFVHKDEEGNITRSAGIMAIVVSGGDICCGDPITVRQPAHRRELQVV